MSTIQTIAAIHGLGRLCIDLAEPNHDLYRWLELENPEYDLEREDGVTTVRVRLPASLWLAMQHAWNPSFDCAHLSDEAIETLVQSAVQERLADGNPHALEGLYVYGLRTDPKEEQLEAGRRWFQNRRGEEQAMLAQPESDARPIRQEPLTLEETAHVLHAVRNMYENQHFGQERELVPWSALGATLQGKFLSQAGWLLEWYDLVPKRWANKP